MKTRNLLVISMTLALLVGLFLAVSIAVAAPSLDGTCGDSGRGTTVNGVTIKKTVDCSKNRNWTWDIFKEADQTSLTLSEDQSFVVNYTVTANATASDTNFAVEGYITIVNNSGAAVTINSVTDNLGPVVCPTLPGNVLDNGNALVCTYSGAPATAVTTNTATVSFDSSTASATSPIDWSLAATTETNECADVTDTLGGTLGNVCANGATSFTFTYAITVGPYDVCGDYTVDNTATVTPTEGGPSDTSSWEVDINVPCAGGCTLTPGYWKTHSTFGPAPYDDTWALIGETTPFFFSGKSYYEALWTSPQGNAYWILAHAYIATQLNMLNGASVPAGVQAAYTSATALFSNPTYTPAYIGGLRGSNPIRQSFISYATILDNYNNGLTGPGHCSE